MRVDSVASGLLRYPENTLPPRQMISPSSASVTSQPTMAGPTLPGFTRVGVKVMGPELSDMP